MPRDPRLAIAERDRPWLARFAILISMLAGNSEEQPTDFDAQTSVRGRPFRPGQSGNPAGRPKALIALETDIREIHGPKALDVLEKLRGLALAGNVPAAKVYLDRVLGPVRPPREPLPNVAPSPESIGAGLDDLLNPVDRVAMAATKRALRLILGQIAALEEKAADEGLLPEESATLADHLRAVAGIGKWHIRKSDDYDDLLDELPEEQARAKARGAICKTLGISLDDLNALTRDKAGTPQG